MTELVLLFCNGQCMLWKQRLLGGVRHAFLKKPDAFFTSSMQIKHTQALNRKWAEDNEVQNCMACGKGFSVTVRRVGVFYSVSVAIFYFYCFQTLRWDTDFRKQCCDSQDISEYSYFLQCLSILKIRAVELTLFMVLFPF